MGALRAFALACAVVCMSCGDDPSTLGRSSTSSGGSSGETSSGDPGTSSGTSGDPGTSSGTSGTSGTVSGGGSTAAEICVNTINEYRKTKGLPPYARWPEAEACSDGQAASDGQTRKAHGAFGKCQEMGQNECPGWPGPAETMIPQCLKAMWGEGPGGGHYEMMVSTRFTKVACGFANGQGGIWSVQNFR
ncbi:MAG: hypothetical protein JST00_47635 [Deltaproteobacteria bacterium]|nr:hypothetical protein [Deltaproteobacteria bacterium]